MLRNNQRARWLKLVKVNTLEMIAVILDVIVMVGGHGLYLCTVRLKGCRLLRKA